MGRGRRGAAQRCHQLAADMRSDQAGRRPWSGVNGSTATPAEWWPFRTARKQGPGRAVTIHASLRHLPIPPEACGTSGRTSMFQPRLRCHFGCAEFSRWSRRSGRRPPPMRHPWVEKNHGLAALRQARTIPRIWATRGSKVSQRSGGDHHPPGGWVPAVYDTAPTPGRCQVRQGSSRSVEMRGVDNVDQRFTVDQSA